MLFGFKKNKSKIETYDKEEIDAIVETLKNKIVSETTLTEKYFPIGSHYVTQTETNPYEILGVGTWERVKGRVLVGYDENDNNFNQIGKTGGASTHQLTAGQLPKLSGTLDFSAENVVNNSGHIIGGATGILSTRELTQAVANTSVSTTQATKRDGFTISFGNNEAHNNLQPYKVVGYMWLRIA